MKRLPAASLLLCIFFLASYGERARLQESPQVLSVKGLQLTASDGSVVAELRVGNGDVPVLSMRAPGKGMTVELTPSGLDFDGDRGNRLTIDMQGVSEPLFPTITMRGPESSALATFMIGPYSHSNASTGLVIVAIDGEGGERMRLGPDQGGDWRLRLKDEAGKNTVVLPALR